MKSSFSKKKFGFIIFFLLLIFIVSIMPIWGALESGKGRIAAHGSGPGTIILLGGVLIGAASWARKK